MYRLLWIVLLLLQLSGCDHSSIPGEESNETNTTIIDDTNTSNETNTTTPADHNTADRNTTRIISHDPLYYSQWYLERNSTYYEAHDIDTNASIHVGNLLRTYTGKGVKIAIIDDGLDTQHEELQDALIASYDIATHTANVAQSTPESHHGTAVTGIIAARANGKGMQGIASEAQVIFLKHKEGMSSSETIELFHKAADLGADVINCSWGTYDVSPSVKETIQDLAIHGRDGKGILIIFAVGNDDREMGNDESAIPEVIAVGATDKDNLRAWYSNYGSQLDLLAPGGYDMGIATIDPMGENGSATLMDNYLLPTDPNGFIGTSASAPIVSGIIALLLEKDPTLTREAIETLLKTNSDKIGSLDYEDGRNDYYGYGKINAGRLLR